MKHLLRIDDLTPDELLAVLELSGQPADTLGSPLTGCGVALLFEKASARTRNAMEMAVAQLGGHPVYIRPEEVGLDERESTEDVLRTLACYHSVVAARTKSHAQLERMAALDAVPVVNLLSDLAHPTQALADLLTIKSCVRGQAKVAFVGDANNVWRSLAIGCAMAGIATTIASPQQHGPTDADLARIKAAGARAQSPVADPLVTDSPAQAVSGANVVYTDVWTSMGQEDERAQRQRAFAGYQVDAALMAAAAPDAIFMHCLPANRGEEVTDEVIDSAASVVWRQAANRLATARGWLAYLASCGAVTNGGTNGGSS